jgi:hypothetical protein
MITQAAFIDIVLSFRLFYIYFNNHCLRFYSKQLKINEFYADFSIENLNYQAFVRVWRIPRESAKISRLDRCPHVVYGHCREQVMNGTTTD